MSSAKLYVFINCVFFMLYGLWGTLMPYSVADFLGLEPSRLGLHQLRAMSAACMVLGLMALLLSRKAADHIPWVLGFIILILAFASGRFLGLILDGGGEAQTYKELGFELIWSLLGAFIVWRSLKKRTH